MLTFAARVDVCPVRLQERDDAGADEHRSVVDDGVLAEFGYAEETSGVLVALRAVGAIGAGLVVARFVRTGPETLWPVVCGVVVAGAVGLLPTVNHAVPIGLWMRVVGLGSGAMTLYFQLTMSDASGPSERGSMMALGGLGWGLSHFTTPLLMGLLADRYGIVIVGGTQDNGTWGIPVRTHALVGTGSAVFTLVSAYGFGVLPGIDAGPEFIAESEHDVEHP